jgi:hypothetical protein
LLARPGDCSTRGTSPCAIAVSVFVAGMATSPAYGRDTPSCLCATGVDRTGRVAGLSAPLATARTLDVVVAAVALRCSIRTAAGVWGDIAGMAGGIFGDLAGRRAASSVPRPAGSSVTRSRALCRNCRVASGFALTRDAALRNPGRAAGDCILPGPMSELGECKNVAVGVAAPGTDECEGTAGFAVVPGTDEREGTAVVTVLGAGESESGVGVCGVVTDGWCVACCSGVILAACVERPPASSTWFSPRRKTGVGAVPLSARRNGRTMTRG